MRHMIAALVCLLLASPLAAEYVPLSPEEARQYIALYPEDAARDLATWDAVEHATPVVTLPQAATLVSGLDVHVTWQGPADVRIADTLHYAITLPPLVAPGIVPPPEPWWVGPAWGVGGAVVGGLTVALLVLVLR